MAGGKRLIIAERLELKGVGSRIRAHPTDGIFQRCADQAGTDDACCQGVHRGVLRGRVATGFAPDLEGSDNPE